MQLINGVECSEPSEVIRRNGFGQTLEQATVDEQNYEDDDEKIDCPLCNSPLEILETTVSDKKLGVEFTAYYAVCGATLGEDPNFGGGYDCEFLIIRETKKGLIGYVNFLNSDELKEIIKLHSGEDAERTDSYKERAELLRISRGG